MNISKTDTKSASKRFLLISQVFYPDEVAVANLMTKLAVELVKSDSIQIDVWCSQPTYTTNERIPHKLLYYGINIFCLRSTHFHKSSKAGRLINYFTFALLVIIKLVFSKKKDPVISHTTPPFLAILLSLICKLKNRPFIYIMMDIFPDGLIRLSIVSKNNYFIKVWQKMHLAAIKNCCKVIVIGRDMEQWIIDICPDVQEKVLYIPLWQDETSINPSDYAMNPVVIKYNLQKDFVVQYSGNMGLWNEMTAFFKAVNMKPDNVKFVFIGGGIRHKELTGGFNEKDPSNVLMLPFIPNNDYYDSVSACHAAMVSLKDGLQGMAVPSKIMGIMAAGIPVIALVPFESEISYIVHEEKCGFVIDPDDYEGLLKAIEILKSDDILRFEMGKRARIGFENKYSLKIVANKYRNVLISTL